MTPYTHRHIVTVLERFRREFPAIMVSGARQTGKTTLLTHFIADRQIPSLTFDDPGEERSAKTDPQTFLALHPAPYLFDEVQYVPELFRSLKMAIDADRRNGMYYLTGSQQFHLAEAAAESLAGRIGIIQLYPLSLRERCGDAFAEPFLPTLPYVQRRLQAPALDSAQLWSYIWSGGYPEVVVGGVAATDFYENYLRTYIERDIRKLTQVGDEMQFLQFITAAAARTGSLINYDDLAREVGISAPTARKWLSLLVSSGIVYLLPPFSTNVEKRVVKTPKLYFADTGLAAYLTRWTSADVLQAGAMAGQIFETYVIGEILKSYTNAGLRPPLYFYRDKDKIEIDLLIWQDNTLYPVEIKKTASPSKRDARNFGILGRIRDITIAPATIVCPCSAPVSVAERVLAVPVWMI